MSTINYEEFVQLVEKYKILPFAAFIPDYPSLTTAADNNDWHSGTGSDPWLWRIRIVQDGVAAYGKFFSDKACFIQTDFFPQSGSSCHPAKPLRYDIMTVRYQELRIISIMSCASMEISIRGICGN